MDTGKLKTALLNTHELSALTDCLEVCKAEGDYATAKLILHEAALLIQAGNANAALLVDDCLLFLAPVDFDSYLRYMEKDRAFEKSFYAPRRKQLKPLVDALQDLADGRLELLTISLPPGVGKALANDTPILTRNGWKNHGDLVVGDEVIGMDGKFKKVIAVHPKCMLDCLVEFTNGEKIQCHENHEWMVHDRAWQGHHDYTCETNYLLTRKLDSGGEVGHRGHRYIFQLPQRSAIQGEHKNLPLDPYTFGVWLGDGANMNPRICCDPKDKAVISRIEKVYPVRWSTVHKTTGVLYFDFDIRKQLRTMGLCHSKKRSPKYIPQEYMTASIEQRLQLMAGLLDTDGTLTGSKYIFTTAEDSLRDSFLELAATFGWRCCVTTHEPMVSSSGVVGRHAYYSIGFTPDIAIPCELERKRNLDPHSQRAIAFKSITRVAPKEGNCITVEGDGMYLAGRTMLPTHNTTLALFYLTWLAGRHPEQPILTGSHSASFVSGTYGEILRLLDENGEYHWHEVFPKLAVTYTNAKDLLIDIGEAGSKGKRFATFEFTSTGAGNAGKLRAGQLLYCDDLIPDLETAMSSERLEKLWQQYTTDLRQRKLGGANELHISTRWATKDILGRLQAQYENSDKARFIVVPALNENDESNFDYPIEAGFTTKFYHEQRDIMDEVSWRSLYQGEPVERYGLLYHPDELRYFFELPDVEPDSILAVCDTKEQGSDYCVMPVVYQYGQDFYIDKFVCDNGKVAMLEEKVAQALVDNAVKRCRIESNRGGTLFAQEVEQKLRDKGGITNITCKWTQTNKETRIEISSAFAKSHFLFRDVSVQPPEYKTAMKQLCSYTSMGKNKNDDVADCISLLVDFVCSFSSNKAIIVKRPF